MDRTLTFEVVRGFRGGPSIAARASFPLDGPPVTVLFGPSGAGKTTVLRAIAGLDRPDRGFIRFGGETWFDSEERRYTAPQGRGVGMLFQDYALFPHLSVEANVAFGLHRISQEVRRSRVAELAGKLGIAELLHRMPSELSGGQRQRVALARALAPSPRLLLLDEPLSALDAPSRDALRGELRALLTDTGLPAIVVTHDRVEALALGDRLAVLVDGSVRQVGPVLEVYQNPVDAEVARVVGTENVLPTRLVRREDGLIVVRSGNAELVAVDPGGVETEAYACIRAEEVVLEPPNAHLSSALNRLEGEIVDCRNEGPLARVTVACGIRLVAVVTHASVERLGLGPGTRVCAVVKTPSVRIVPLKTPSKGA